MRIDPYNILCEPSVPFVAGCLFNKHMALFFFNNTAFILGRHQDLFALLFVIICFHFCYFVVV